MKKLKKVAAIDIPEIDQIRENVSEENKQYITKAMAIADYMHRMLEAKSLLQKDLASLMEKSEAEVSKMCSGNHNLTVRTITNMEHILHDDIITIPSLREQARKGFLCRPVYRTSIETRKNIASLLVFEQNQGIYSAI
jgi:hypothetical protein